MPCGFYLNAAEVLACWTFTYGFCFSRVPSSCTGFSVTVDLLRFPSNSASPCFQSFLPAQLCFIFRLYFCFGFPLLSGCPSSSVLPHLQYSLWIQLRPAFRLSLRLSFALSSGSLFSIGFCLYWFYQRFQSASELSLLDSHLRLLFIFAHTFACTSLTALLPLALPGFP